MSTSTYVNPRRNMESPPPSPPELLDFPGNWNQLTAYPVCIVQYEMWAVGRSLWPVLALLDDCCNRFDVVESRCPRDAAAPVSLFLCARLSASYGATQNLVQRSWLQRRKSFCTRAAPGSSRVPAKSTRGRGRALRSDVYENCCAYTERYLYSWVHTTEFAAISQLAGCMQ